MARKNTTARAPKRRSNTMWGGRYKLGPAEIMEKINASIGFDRRLYAQDIAGSLAHCDMLVAQGILTAKDGRAIKRGLAQGARRRSRPARFKFSTKLEDIHFNVEARLTDAHRPGRRPPAHRRARATTRSRSMSGCGCATRSTAWSRCCATCRRR